MADVLTDLLRALANSNTKLTEQESKAFADCLHNSVRDGFIGTSLAGNVAWIASRRLSRFFRYSLVGGVGIACGMWCIDRSFHSSLDRILSMEGRVKNELARVMVLKYRNDSRTRKLLTKHFHSEKVFDDSTPDRPELMFQLHNAYIDNAAQISRLAKNYGHGDPDEKKIVITDSSRQRENNDAEKVRKAVPEWRQANDGLFDSLFDPSDVSGDEVVHASNSPSSRTKQQTRRERRIQRHGRLHRRRHSDSLTMDDA